MLTAGTVTKVPEAGRNSAARVTTQSETARHDDMRTTPAIREAQLAQALRWRVSRIQFRHLSQCRNDSTPG